MTIEDKAKEMVKKYGKENSLLVVDDIINECGKLKTTISHSKYGKELENINGKIKIHYVKFGLYWSAVETEIQKL
jgi:hypothetical protein